MLQIKLQGKNLKKAKALSLDEIEKILGGLNPYSGGDGKDCNSELASGGGTTDTDEISAIRELSKMQR